MKILGISFGSKNGDNHRNLTRVLAAAAELGAETKLVDTAFMYIAPAQPEAPDMEIRDDFQSLLDEILDCDGLVVGCPVYALTPVGQFKGVVDRIAAKYGIASGENRMAAPIGPKYISYISVGGARDHNWVSLCLPMMKLLGNVLGCQEIDEMDVHGRPAAPQRLAQLGKAMVSALDHQDGSYRGDHVGICPHCHCDFVSILSGTNVICPVCGAKGTLVFEEDCVWVSYA